jgi:glucokinase
MPDLREAERGDQMRDLYRSPGDFSVEAAADDSSRRTVGSRVGVGVPMPVGAPLVGAVDIGATKTCVAAIALPLVAWDASIPVRRFRTSHDPETLADSIAAALSDLAPWTSLLALGVAAPGPLDPRSGMVGHSPNLGWRDVPLGALLSARVGAQVVLEDDANAGGLGEAVLGAGLGADPVAYVTVSTGIGAGIVVHGRVVGGAHRAAGEIGHLTINQSGPRCGCGRRGHVEAYAGGAGLARRARSMWPARLLPDGSPAPRSASAIIRLARRGDPAARLLVDEASTALAHAFAVLAAVVDPERIVIGGSIGLGQPGLIRTAVARARRLPIRDAGARLTVVRCALAEASPLAGAAVLAARLATESIQDA